MKHLKTHITYAYARRLINRDRARVIKYLDPRTANPCPPTRNGALMELEIQCRVYGYRRVTAPTEDI